jgi:hypothetical protein
MEEIMRDLNLVQGEFFFKSDPSAQTPEQLDAEIRSQLEEFQKSQALTDQSPAARAAGEGEPVEPEVTDLAKAKAYKMGEKDMYKVTVKGKDGKDYDTYMDKGTYEGYTQHLSKFKDTAGQAATNPSGATDLHTSKSIMTDPTQDPDAEPEDMSKAILDSLDQLEADDLGTEPDPDAEGDVEFKDATPLLKGMIKMLGHNSKVLSANIEDLNKSMALVKQVQLEMLKSATKTQQTVTQIADQPAQGGRRSAQGGDVSEEDMQKALAANAQGWDSIIGAAEKAITAKAISGRDLVTIDTYKSNNRPIPLFQAERPELFQKLQPHFAN